MADFEVTLADYGDWDLYCLRCGYNLRGQAGDPKRCPECGISNRVEDMVVSSDHIAKQLRKLESAPTYCFAAILAALTALFFIVISFDDPGFFKATATIWAPAIVFAAIAWPVGRRRFAASCLNQPACDLALFKYVLLGAAIFVLAFGALLGTCFVPVSILSAVTGGGKSAATAIFLLVVPVLWVLAGIGVRKLYRVARGVLIPLQREVAVAMYRREERSESR
ncbi:MAG: hypothetical protein H6817_01115 [Phycisphaerales bacterium]|nr:hypothetical protein [Phycisphaerales bacterium]